LGFPNTSQLSSEPKSAGKPDSNPPFTSAIEGGAPKRLKQVNDNPKNFLFILKYQNLTSISNDPTIE
jgi:hypothetical protein